eukprot:scaffold270_cov121-Isochrysis_galbana.AAC.1
MEYGQVEKACCSSRTCAWVRFSAPVSRASCTPNSAPIPYVPTEWKWTLRGMLFMGTSTDASSWKMSQSNK